MIRVNLQNMGQKRGDMKILVILTLILTLTALPYAQDIISQRGIIQFMPLYQRWGINDGDNFSEFSMPLFIYFPVNRNFGLSLRGNGASASGDNLETLSGLTDTQLNANYYIENANVIFNLGINLPTGKKDLSLQEFRTSNLISHNIFKFQIPNFGQGLNVTAGFTWVQPLNESVVFGLGASYQYKAGFKPLKNFIENYNPGDEILLTGGFDVRLSPTATLSSDVIFTIFGTDKIGDDEVFAPGNRLVLNGQFRKYFNFNEFRLFVRYRIRAKNEQAIVLGEALSQETEKTFPNQLEVLSYYRIRFNQRFYSRVLFEGRFYQKAPGFVSFQETLTSAGVNLFGFGLISEILPSLNFSVPVTFKYFLGSFKEGPDVTGLEIGLGLKLNY